VNGDHAVANAGPILWTDLLLPVFGLAAVWAHHRTLARESVTDDAGALPEREEPVAG